MAKPSRMVYQTEDTRKLILDRAEQLFVQCGFFDTQMKDIAEAIGMSRHTLYRYYQDKKDLGMAIAGRIMEAQLAGAVAHLERLVLQSSRSGLERLKELILEEAQRLMDSADGHFLAEFDAYFTSHRAPEDFVERLLAQGFGVPSNLELLIAQGHADGSLRKDLGVAQVLAVLTGLRAVQKEVVLRGNLLLGIDAEQVNEVPTQLAELMVAGMAAESS